MNATFTQSLDADRAHTLLTKNTKQSGSLEYRYDDTGEIVTVPNIWYNQTFQERVAAVRWDASLEDERATKMEKNPPHNMSRDAVSQIVTRLRAKAILIRSEADRMEAAGRATHPVKASLMQLHYDEDAKARNLSRFG